MNNIPTPHITAKKDEIAKTVIMPGDPLRAKFIADTYLENVVCVNTVRNMLAYTGTYKGKSFTIMGSGMGMPSMGIYSYELFEFYDVDNIIRIGSAGGFSEDLNVYDVILATSAHTQSNYAKIAFDFDEEELDPSLTLNEKLRSSAKVLEVDLIEGKIETSDAFYKTTQEKFGKVMKEKGCIAGEMEAYALFANAKICGKNAACIVTISDHMIKRQNTPASERETAFTAMMEIVLNADY